jgi:hypothetical protein
MPSQQLEELYATVNKPRRVSSVNENIPTDQVDSGQPATTVNSLMMEPSVALTPIIYRRQQPPQQEIQQVRKVIFYIWVYIFLLCSEIQV